MNTKKYCAWYTIWDKKTDEFLCSGTAKECARALGFKTENSFLSSIGHFAAKGGSFKYDILREEIKRDELYE